MDRSVMLYGLADWSRGFPDELRPRQATQEDHLGQTSIASSQWIPWIAKTPIFLRKGLDAPSPRRV